MQFAGACEVVMSTEMLFVDKSIWSYPFLFGRIYVMYESFSTSFIFLSFWQAF